MRGLQELSGLMLFAPAADSPLWALAELERRREQGASAPALRREIAEAFGRLLRFGAEWGLRGNLWHAALTFEILRSENPWSLACEGRGDPGGTLFDLAAAELDVYRRLMDAGPWDLAPGLRQALTDFDPGTAAGGGAASALLSSTAAILGSYGNTRVFAEAVSWFYRQHGAGRFALDRAFRLTESGGLCPIRGMAPASLDALVGVEVQRRQLTDNTAAFLRGAEANNVLLYGDAGTGKSTCVRALLSEYPDSPLRLVELHKARLHLLPELLAALRRRNYRFILFLDDLSFEEQETAYKYLKAAIEGGLETLPENVRIYATSNRRHLVRETWNDRADMEHGGDVHRSDTVEEKLSLAGRFGVAISFSAPDRRRYHAIVRALADRAGLGLDEAALLAGADAWEIRHGGKTGRAARQYVDYLAGREQA